MAVSELREVGENIQQESAGAACGTIDLDSSIPAYDNRWSYVLYRTLAETGDVLYVGLRDATGTPATAAAEAWGNECAATAYIFNW